METSKTTLPKEGESVYFMMNMPPWYINLPDEQKTSLAKKYAGNSSLDQALSEAEIADLLAVSTK